MEGAATTVYAQGGRGNSRLVAWEGERTLTFTMEDALISPAGFMILSGAGLVEASDEEGKSIKVHATETTNKTEFADGTLTVYLKEKPYYDSTSGEDYIYVMLLDNGEIVSEPYIAVVEDEEKDEEKGYPVVVKTGGRAGYTSDLGIEGGATINSGDAVFVDYYTEKTSKTQQIEITADKFGGNYYLEASTLFRTEEGIDLPAEIIIPNCKIQSNFTFTMASTGDPSTFTFTMDAFPDYTRFDNEKKVLVAIQVIDDSDTLTNQTRERTYAGATETDF